MIDPHVKLPANRILVTLDTSTRGQAALEAAILLASGTSAELEGLFVEDEDLLRLASLPFASEIELSSATTRELQVVAMERALRKAAEETQQAFVNSVRQLNLSWTFRIVRGSVTLASLAAAGDVDLLVIGQQGRSSYLATSDYLPKRIDTERPVVAVFDASPSAYRVLELANHLAKSADRHLAVLELGRSGEHPSKGCDGWLHQQAVRAEVTPISHPSQDAIEAYLRKCSPGVLVINRDSSFAGYVQIRRLVDEFECPLVLC